MITQPIIISKYKKNTVTGHNDEHVIKLNVVEIYTGNKFINNEKKCDVNFGKRRYHCFARRNSLWVKQQKYFDTQR